MFGLPGRSYRGPFLPLTPEERSVQDALVRHVVMLAGTIGERHIGRREALVRAADYICGRFEAHDFVPTIQEYDVGAVRVRNIEAERRGTTDEMLIIGAHYDTVPGCPGANDNASGIAALLELSRLLSAGTTRTLRFVAFVNEEPPYFMTDSMGSRVYARRCRERGDAIAGMFSLETIGYYSDERGTQQYPVSPLFHMMYPDTGNFIGFVANIASRGLMREAGREFRRSIQFPSEGAAAPADIPGVGWSDHWSFWQEGYPAVMLTDTAPYRYPHYHQPSDTPEQLTYDPFARVVFGLGRMFAALAKK
jgi:Zn-dependent M28 family amino/carboxypeptidase